MPAARCDSCEISYPAGQKRCHVCGGDLRYTHTRWPDPDWRERAAPAAGNPPQSESDRIEIWRLRVLLAAGYDAEAADLLARRDDVDLHQAVELVEHGCPTTTALRILT